MAISDQLTLLNNTKTAIRTAINNKGGSVGASDTFASYATAIDNLPSGGSGNPLLTSIDVSDFTGSTFNDAKSYITDVTIPSGVTSIAAYAFQNCRITNITLPSALTSLGSSAFINCQSLTSIEIPSGVTQLNSICDGCTSLQTVTLHEGLQRIHGFKNCSSLTTVSVPSTVNYVSNGAFSGCTGLVSIVFNSTTVPTLQATGAFNNTNNCPIYVPASSVDTYKAASNWSDYASRIYPIQQVATVDGNPVYNYDLGMTSTDTITSENMAKMPAGTSVEFAEGLTNIAAGEINYQEVTLPSTFTGFGDSDMIGSSVTTITSNAVTPPSAFRNQLGGSGLTAIYVPSSAVDTYKAHAAWGTFSSIIQAIPTE